MEQSHEHRDVMCKLKKSLYGLKQSLRDHFFKFSNAISEFYLLKCQTFHSVFHLHTNAGLHLMIVYVEKIVITRSHSRQLVG